MELKYKMNCSFCGGEEFYIPPAIKGNVFSDFEMFVKNGNAVMTYPAYCAKCGKPFEKTLSQKDLPKSITFKFYPKKQNWFKLKIKQIFKSTQINLTKYRFQIESNNWWHKFLFQVDYGKQFFWWRFFDFKFNGGLSKCLTIKSPSTDWIEIYSAGLYFDVSFLLLRIGVYFHPIIYKKRK